MNKKIGIIIAVVLVLLGVTGFVVYNAVFLTKPAATPDAVVQTDLPPADAAISVDLTKSTAKDNTLVLTVKGLASKYKSIAYELSYETKGVVQGVTSNPLDLTGKDTFVRDDIYLGTCSKNVCTPHLGVTKVTVTLAFTDTSGKQTQFSKDYPF